MIAFPSRVLVFLLVVISCEAHAATVYIHPSSAWQISSWRYFKGNQEPPSNWRELDFDDSDWTSGKAPFGYGVRGFVRYGTLLADMRQGYTSVFLRKHFYVDDLAKTTALKLSVNYGDGFVAWLNGVQIASQNAPDKATAASTATAEHPGSAEHRYQVFSVAGAPVRLGRNVLAILVLTRSRDRDSALLDASLIDTRNLAFQRPATASSIQRNARFFQPSAAVDGTQLTFWSSAEGQGDIPVSFTVDLGQLHTIDRLRLHWWGGKLPGLGGGPRDYEVHVSEDSQTWKTVASLSNEKGGERTIDLPAIKTRQVRLHMTAANAARGSIGLLDFEVFAEGVPLDAREFDGLSLFKPATASTRPSPGSPPAKAVDNNAASWWVSQPGAPDPQWLAVDLEDEYRVSAVKVYFSERFAEKFTVQLAVRENEWRDIDYTVDTEEIASGDNHRIHRVMFAQEQEARYARILLWGTNPHAKEYGNRYTPTEFVVIGVPLPNQPPVHKQPPADR
jgi:hypothetical protein